MKKILIAEDELDQQTILQELLAMENEFEIVSATDGEQVLEILKNQKIDLIILDISMPNINGLTVLQKVKESPEVYGNPKIIIFSNYLNELNLKVAKKLRADAYKFKLETEPAELLKSVNALLQPQSVKVS